LAEGCLDDSLFPTMVVRNTAFVYQTAFVVKGGGS